MRKMFMGVRLRALREQRQLTQAKMAQQLGISPSYLNQIESNERPLTVPVLLRLQSRLGIDPQFFSEDDEARLMAQIQDVLADTAAHVPTAELRALVQQMPAMAEAMVSLHRRCRNAEEHLAHVSGSTDDRHPLDVAAAQQPHEEVRDYFYAHHNYIAVLDELAESIYETLIAVPLNAPRQSRAGHLTAHALIERLTDYLREKHDVIVLYDPDRSTIRSFDAAAHTLTIGGYIEPGQQAFQLATQLAYLEAHDCMESLTADTQFSTDAARMLTRIGLASYFAGALVLPYQRFHQAAEQLSYDIELLAERFGVSYETVCHRLSTLQRQEARGVPFFFIRVDRAGNISKRQSATDFHFSRTGGTCPLWNVYEAFSQPDKIHTQLARMPDGRVYLWIARSITRRYGGYGGSVRTFAVALGCDLRHAERLVYAKGLNLQDPEAATPIGTGCKVCERTDCGQRAFPALGRPLRVDPHSRQWEPYPMDRQD